MLQEYVYFLRKILAPSVNNSRILNKKKEKENLKIIAFASTRTYSEVLISAFNLPSIKQSLFWTLLT